MKRKAILVLGAFICVQIAYAADNDAEASRSDFSDKTVAAVTDTTKSAVKGTEDIAKASVADTVDAPRTAIQAVKDTANAALSGTDAALKTITGEEI